MVSLISLFSFKWMQHSSLTISTVVLHCCMGLNICPFQPQKWLCSSGGWFLSIQGSSEAWKCLSIRHDILSAAAEPLGSPPFNIHGTGVGDHGSPVPHTWHRLWHCRRGSGAAAEAWSSIAESVCGPSSHRRRGKLCCQLLLARS